MAHGYLVNKVTAFDLNLIPPTPVSRREKGAIIRILKSPSLPGLPFIHKYFRNSIVMMFTRFLTSFGMKPTEEA
jgi:hypothetical protein